MMMINRETDYAGRVLLFLSRRPQGTRTTAQEVARECLVPGAIVRRVVTRLASAGLLASVRGSGGGISLGRSPKDITLLDVVEAFEGPVALNACIPDPKQCPLLQDCTVHIAWMQANETLVNYLRSVTFDRLAQQNTDVPEQTQRTKARTSRTK